MIATLSTVYGGIQTSCRVVASEEITAGGTGRLPARVQQEVEGDGTWVELLHCNRSRDINISGRDPTCCLAMSSSSESEDSEAEWEELDASQREGEAA